MGGGYSKPDDNTLSECLAPFNAVLRVVSGPSRGKLFRLDRARQILGRDDPPFAWVDLDLSGCEVGQASVSRRHAEILWVDDALMIVDLLSRNGTEVDGQRLRLPESGRPPTATRLKPGSKVKLGAVEFVVDVVSL